MAAFKLLRECHVMKLEPSTRYLRLMTPKLFHNSGLPFLRVLFYNVLTVSTCPVLVYSSHFHARKSLLVYAV